MAQAGFNGRLFIGAEGAGATATDEVQDAQDVTINLSGETFETSSRRTAPWKAFISGWREWSVDFTLVHENNEDAIDALEAAYLAGTVISCRMLDKDGDGYYGDCLVTSFTRDEPMSDKMTRAVTLQGTGAASIINATS